MSTTTLFVGDERFACKVAEIILHAGGAVAKHREHGTSHAVAVLSTDPDLTMKCIQEVACALS